MMWCDHKTILVELVLKNSFKGDCGYHKVLMCHLKPIFSYWHVKRKSLSCNEILVIKIRRRESNVKNWLFLFFFGLFPIYYIIRFVNFKEYILLFSLQTSIPSLLYRGCYVCSCIALVHGCVATCLYLWSVTDFCPCWHGRPGSLMQNCFLWNCEPVSSIWKHFKPCLVLRNEQVLHHYYYSTTTVTHISSFYCHQWVHFCHLRTERQNSAADQMKW